MPIGTLVAVTPGFLRFLSALSESVPLRINQGGVVKAVGHYATVVQFHPGETFGIPHWLAYQMAEHERNLTQCLKLIDGYNRMGGWK